MLGAREHQHLEPVVGLDQMRQQFALATAIDHQHALLDQFGGGIAAGHLDQLRRLQQPVGERLDLVGEGGREQQVLPRPRQQRQHLADVVDEAHVEHPVGLVEHQDLDLRQVDRALADVIQQPAGGRHQDVHPPLELTDLRLDADAAEHHHRTEPEVLAVVAHRLLDLGGQFAGRRQHQRADRPAATGRALRPRVVEPLQHRQREPGGLAGAGLSGAHQVAAGQHRGNRLRLDRRGLGVAAFGDRAHQRVAQAELGEAGHRLIVRPRTGRHRRGGRLHFSAGAGGRDAAGRAGCSGPGMPGITGAFGMPGGRPLGLVFAGMVRTATGNGREGGLGGAQQDRCH